MAEIESAKRDVRINIARDFSSMPGPRTRESGMFSGEEFYEELLLPKFRQAEELGVKLIVNVDGLFGYPSSFIDASFGRLIRELGRATVDGRLIIEAIADQFALKEINYCLETADKPRN